MRLEGQLKVISPGLGADPLPPSESFLPGAHIIFGEVITGRRGPADVKAGRGFIGSRSKVCLLGVGEKPQRESEAGSNPASATC